MELRHLIYFRKVAEVLHFSKAAQELHISQPPLTRQIKELEKELGVILFERNNKRVTLTEAGRYFLRESGDVMRTLERAKQVVKQVHEAVNGEFRIGYISATSKAGLTKVIRHLSGQFPFLKTRLYELPTVKQVKAIEDGKLDVGIMRAPVHSAHLKQQRLTTDEFILVSSLSNLLTMDGEHLSQQPFISYNRTYAPDYQKQFIACCNRLGFSPDIRHECNNIYSILSMVENGLGIAVVPASTRQQYPFLKLASYELGQAGSATEIVLAHQHSLLHPAMDFFAEQCHDILGSNIDEQEGSDEAFSAEK